MTIAYVGTGKPTYLFADLDPTTCAADRLTASEFYLNSQSGNIPGQQFPEALQSAQVVKIPAV